MKGDDGERARLYRLSVGSLAAIDDSLESAGLQRIDLVRDHPGLTAVHKFDHTIAGMAVLKVPTVFGVDRHAGS